MLTFFNLTNLINYHSKIPFLKTLNKLKTLIVCNLKKVGMMIKLLAIKIVYYLKNFKYKEADYYYRINLRIKIFYLLLLIFNFSLILYFSIF